MADRGETLWAEATAAIILSDLEDRNLGIDSLDSDIRKEIKGSITGIILERLVYLALISGGKE